MKKKFLIMAVAMALVCAFAVGMTVAYLTSNDTVTNTFTVGKVAIALDEADVDIYGVQDGNERVKANDYKLIPGHEYTKDPIVHVASDSEKSWLFITVDNGIANIEMAQGTVQAIDEEGNPTKTYSTIANQILDNDWEELKDNEGNLVAYYRLFDPATAIANPETGDFDYAVFGNFAISGDVQANALNDYDGNKIIVNAYAIQWDGFTSAAAAWDKVSK